MTEHAPIGRLHHTILDCREPEVVAEFYSALLGLPITHRSPDFVVVARDNTTSGIGFQLAPDHEPPRWPDPQYPQQVHFDVMVDDVAVAHEAVLRIGARPIGDPHVFADPAGHPFCLIPRPGWAAPVKS